MIKKKNALIIFVFSIIFIYAFTGCSNDKTTKSNSQNPLVINVWHYYNGSQKKAFDDMVTEFNETVGYENKIMIDSVSLGGVNELIDAIDLSAKKEVGSEPMPDIFASYADLAFELDKMGLLASISDYLTEKEIDEYMKPYIEEGKFGTDGSFKIFPTAKSTEILYLSKTDWDEFVKGIKGKAEYEQVNEDYFKTWEGVIKIAETYYKWTDDMTPQIADDGKAFIGIDAEANYIITTSKQLGYDIISVKDGKGTFTPNREVLKRLWDGYYVPSVQGYFKSVGKFRSDDIKTGYIIASVGSSSGCTYFPDQVTFEDGTQHNIEAAVYPLPVFEGGEKYCVQQGAGMAITKSTSEKEKAAVLFLRWMTEAERNAKFSLASGYMPVKTEAMNIEFLHKIAKNMNPGKNSKTIVISSIEVAAQQLNEYTPYASKPFNGSVQCRNILANSIKEFIKDGNEKIELMLSQGLTKKEAIEAVTTDEIFELWIQDLNEKLNEVLK